MDALQEAYLTLGILSPPSKQRLRHLPVQKKKQCEHSSLLAPSTLNQKASNKDGEKETKYSMMRALAGDFDARGAKKKDISSLPTVEHDKRSSSYLLEVWRRDKAKDKKIDTTTFK